MDEDPDQTAPFDIVCSDIALFAILLAIRLRVSVRKIKLFQF